MKYIDMDKLEPGMILADSIYNEQGTIELLSKGIVLTQRQIDLLKNAGVLDVKVETEEADLVQGTQKEDKDIIDLDVEEVITNIVNQNMKINVLTGEGNRPIDEKHIETISDTREIFNKVIESENIDIKSVEENVKKMIPDMIRNDDVMMRLSQLKQSDDYTFEHSLRVAILAVNIAKWLGYSREMIEEVAQAGLLFDIGKMKVPSYLLKKHETLTDEEMKILKKHPQLGYNVLLKTKGVPSSIKYSALQHHEKMDGSGYPLRLRSGQIHEYAKIIMVCDVFDAMITDKPYGMGVSKMEAAEYLNWNTSNHFDEKVVYVFLKKMSEYFLAKKVILNTGEAGKIVYIDVNFPTKPTVKVGDRMVDLTKNKDIKIIKIIES